MASGYSLSALWFPFTVAGETCLVLPDGIVELLTGPWGLIIMSLIVFADAFLVVVPGEIAVSMIGALSAATGLPPLWAIIVCAATAASSGDLLCYALGRLVGTSRWRWMRTSRFQRAQAWARDKLRSGIAVVLFTARFIPFARLAINLAAGATRVPLRRYLPLVFLAATGWATYQAGMGALVASIVPGGPFVAVLISVLVAVGLGTTIDLVIRRVTRRKDSSLPREPSQQMPE